MIPEVVKEFIKLPVAALTTSRDANLQPSIIRVFGAKLHPNQTTVTFYIPECGSEQTIANFEDNGRVALTMCTPGNNDSYQLKGKFVSWRRNAEQDDQYVDEYLSKVLEQLIRTGIPEEFLSKASCWRCKPGIAVTFDVETVFGQAPRPNTGERIA